MRVETIYRIIVEPLAEGFIVLIGLALMLPGGGLILFEYLWEKPVPLYMRFIGGIAQ